MSAHQVSRVALAILASALIVACGASPAQEAATKPASELPTPSTALSPTPTPETSAVPSPSPTSAPTPTTVVAAEIRDLKVEIEDGKIVVSYAFTGQLSDYNALKFFIDSDQSAKTGYKVGTIGAEIMAENAALFRYTGDGTSWSWEQISLDLEDFEYEPTDGSVSWRLSWAKAIPENASQIDIGAQLVNTNWDAVAFAVKQGIKLN